MIKYYAILAIFFLGTAMLFSQETASQKNLLKKVDENLELLSTDPEKAFREAKKIEKEAQKINVKEAELRAIRNQSVYYKISNDFEKMMITAQSLSQKAGSYKMPIYQAIAKRYLFEAYIFIGLPEKAFLQLEEGMKFLDKMNKEDSLSIITKADLFTSYSNYYSLKSDYKNQLKYIKLSGEELEKMPEGKQKLLYIHYSNLAASYNEIDQQDSAKYYAEMSQSKDERFELNHIQSRNLWVLGNVAMKKTDYKKALSYFKEAEKLNGYKNYLNIETLYDNIIESYQKLQQRDSVKLYYAKKDSLKFGIVENQNKSLLKLLGENDNSNNKKYIYISIFVFIVMFCIIFFVVRKNKILADQEKISQKYLNEVFESPNGEDYSKLLKALKEKDPAFMFYFDETFPEFSSKLLKINPKISSTEIEFCALLKIKIPTKDIARYRYIEPQTVRNKKYLIRKKLRIPKESDIYQWFDGI